jgi:hypothetical protein
MGRAGFTTAAVFQGNRSELTRKAAAGPVEQRVRREQAVKILEREAKSRESAAIGARSRRLE